jgi:hypothetical protein
VYVYPCFFVRVEFGGPDVLVPNQMFQVIYVGIQII